MATDDKAEVDNYDLPGLKALIEATCAIRRTHPAFDQANKGSATLGMWREVRLMLTRLTVLKAACLRRTHVQLIKHYVYGMQGRQCHNPDTLIGTEMDKLLSMDRVPVYSR